jgi:hypothetical protein
MIRRFGVHFSIFNFNDVGFFGLMIVIFILSMWWTFSRGCAILQDWAQQNNVELVEYHYRWFARGPFVWRSKSHSIYQITVRDEFGNLRSGWARVGSWWWGLWQRKVDVRWDDEGKNKRKDKVKNG